MMNKIKEIECKSHTITTSCAYCGTEFNETPYTQLSRFILEHKPACSYECNKALGQVK